MAWPAPGCAPTEHTQTPKHFPAGGGAVWAGRPALKVTAVSHSAPGEAARPPSHQGRARSLAGALAARGPGATPEPSRRELLTLSSPSLLSPTIRSRCPSEGAHSLTHQACPPHGPASRRTRAGSAPATCPKRAPGTGCRDASQHGPPAPLQGPAGLTELWGGTVALWEALRRGEPSRRGGHDVRGEWWGRWGSSSPCRRRSIATWNTGRRGG